MASGSVHVRNTDLTRQQLLTAAADLLLAGGVNRLTLDAVAARAGVSKGGLLHHYASKDALLLGLADRLVQRFRDDLQVWLDRETPGTPGRWARAYVHATFAPGQDAHDEAVFLALAGAVAAQPTLNAHLRTLMTFVDEDSLQDGLPPARATALRLACDGLWLSDLAGLPPVRDAHRADLYAQLLAWTQP